MLSILRETDDKFILFGDFNLDEIIKLLSEYLCKNHSKNLVQKKTCFKDPDKYY